MIKIVLCTAFIVSTGLGSWKQKPIVAIIALRFASSRIIFWSLSKCWGVVILMTIPTAAREASHRRPLHILAWKVTAPKLIEFSHWLNVRVSIVWEKASLEWYFPSGNYVCWCREGRRRCFWVWDSDLSQASRFSRSADSEVLCYHSEVSCEIEICEQCNDWICQISGINGLSTLEHCLLQLAK